MEPKCKARPKDKAIRKFVDSQRDEILRMLRLAGTEGVSRATLIFNNRYTQCGARIFELKRRGYVIRSEDRGENYPTWYVLESEPLFDVGQCNEH